MLGRLRIGASEPEVPVHERPGSERSAAQLCTEVRADDELVVEGRVVLEESRQQLFYSKTVLAS